ncbi:MAG: hypothetical protein ACP5U2_12220 [Bryobacteraceae bacterium]
MRKLVSVLLLGLVLLPQFACGAPVGRAVARAASRRAVRARILRLDALRHRVPVRPLAQPRTVQRYTTKRLAEQELRRGIAPGRHMTAVARPGRPMSGEKAKEYYGLLRKPTVRETIQLPKGTPVRHSHATNAARGVRELTSPKPVPPEAIKKVVPLPR